MIFFIAISLSEYKANKNVRYFYFPALDPGPQPQFVFDGPGLNLYLAARIPNLFLSALALKFLFFILQLTFVIVRVSIYIISASTYMYLLYKYNVGNNKLQLFEEEMENNFSFYQDSQKQPGEVFYTKKVFLKIKNSQENTSARVFFNKFTGLSPAILLNKKLRHRCFSVKLGKF